MIFAIFHSIFSLLNAFLKYVGISACSVPGGPLVQQSGLKISNELILRVHVVYVLGLLLVGKHRKKVNKLYGNRCCTHLDLKLK